MPETTTIPPSTTSTATTAAIAGTSSTIAATGTTTTTTTTTNTTTFLASATVTPTPCVIAAAAVTATATTAAAVAVTAAAAAVVVGTVSDRPPRCRRRLPVSTLGSLSHWDQFYETEVQQVLSALEANKGQYGTVSQQQADDGDAQDAEDSDGDGGDMLVESGAVEVWFGPAKQRRLLQFIEQLVQRTQRECPPCAVVVVDVGTGNGMFLVQMCRRRWRRRRMQQQHKAHDTCSRQKGEAIWHLIGVDYSEPSVQLATRIAEATMAAAPVVHGRGSPSPTAAQDTISFRRHDMVNGGPIKGLAREGGEGEGGGEEMVILHDKGTYDAISLNEDDTMPERYRRNIHDTLTGSGESRAFFLITSCNFSRDELELDFCSASPDGPQFRIVDELPHESILFGGVRGQTVTTLLMEAIAIPNPAAMMTL